MSFLKISKVKRAKDNFELEVINKNNAVAVVLFNHTYEKILLVKQFRAGSNSELYELPAGIIEKGEEPKNAIMREIREETGYEEESLDDIVFLGDYYTTPGYSTEKILIYKARVKEFATQKDQQLDEHEIIDLEWVKIEDVQNKTNCMKTIFGLTKALSLPKKKIGVFGGTFNPITNMHLTTVERAIDEFELDLCILEPVNTIYSYKSDMEDSTHRCKMIEKAIADNPKLVLGTYECKSLTQPPTYLTLNYYKEKYGWCEIYFICGSDNLKSLDTWANYRTILDKYKIICLQRDGDNIYQDIILPNQHFVKRKNNIKIIYENVINNISSTSIRNLVRAGMSIKYLVPKEIEEYIKENKLYL